LIVRSAGSKEKMVLAPTRVRVPSSAIISARAPAPVRMTSGILKTSFTSAEWRALEEMISTLLTTWVSLDCFKSTAPLADCKTTAAKISDTHSFFIFTRTENLANRLVTDACLMLKRIASFPINVNDFRVFRSRQRGTMAQKASDYLEYDCFEKNAVFRPDL